MTFDQWERDCRAMAVRDNLSGDELDRMLSMHKDRPATAPVKFGEEEGETCWRNGCAGVIALKEKEEGCSCHINPPCHSCITPREHCPVCDWDAEEEEKAEYMNGFRMKVADDAVRTIISYERRPLDPRKIDYHSMSHSNSSMKKVGVYPEGTTRTQVEALVKGTFGGRFESFGDGKFSYIAYTD